MPVLGLGVYRNYTTRDSVLEAFSAGYRCAATARGRHTEARPDHSASQARRHRAGVPQRGARRRGAAGVGARAQRRLHQ